MKLHHQIYGSGEPLIIVHGLFGTFENWGSQIKTFSQQYQVIAVDLRNHGRSPHCDEMTYPAMAADIVELMDDLGIERAHMLGHSMGGKAMMQLALTHPERIQQLIIVDIAPVHYPHHHQQIFSGLFSIDLDSLKSRGDADKQLQAYVEDLSVRAFLLKNLYRDEQKHFRWRMNLPVLDNQYQAISLSPVGDAYQGNTLFIKGSNSDYLLPKYRDEVLALFPKASYKVIDGAGHWPHAEKAEMFSRIVSDFLHPN